MRRNNFNPTTLDKFALECSGNDQTTYANLMVSSCLFTSSEIQFYRTVLTNTLESSLCPIFSASFRHWQFDRALRSKGEEFSKNILQVRQRCVEHLTSTYVVSNLTQLHKLLDYSILKLCVGSYLGPTFVKDVCAEVIKYLKLKRCASKNP